MIKKILCDMDGTLLANNGKISDRNVEAIADANIPLTLVSARAPMEMAYAIDRLNLNSSQIGFNGGLIFRKVESGGWQKIMRHPLNIQAAKQLIPYIYEKYPQYFLSYYTLDQWFCPRFHPLIKHQMSITDCEPEMVDLEKNLAELDEIYKIMLITNKDEEVKALQDDLISLGIPEVNIQKSNYQYLEITSQKAQKSLGIDFLFKTEQLQKSETAAFGDGPNDIAMFERVAEPIAMANATDSVKAIANYVSRSNEEDGVAYGIENYLKKL